MRCGSPQSLYIEQAAERLACVSIAPLGLPVVPPVYCSSAMSSTSTFGHCRGSLLAPLARSWSKRTTGASAAIGVVGIAEGPNAVSSPTIEVVDQAVGFELLRHQRHEADVGGDEDARAGVLQLEGQLSLRIERREVHHARAAFERREEADRVIGRVGQVQRDRFAGSGAKLHQPGGDRLDRFAQFGVAGLLVAILERGISRPPGW